MANLHEILGDAQKAEAEARTAARQAKDQAIAALNTAQRNIDIAVETTGSYLHDSVIVLYGSDLAHMPQIVPNYEEVAERLKGKSGEPVVAVHRWRERTGRIGRRIPPQYSVKHAVHVGVLSGEELQFDYDEKTCSLPTERYANWPRAMRSEPETTEGALIVASQPGGFRFGKFGFDLGYDLHTPLDQSNLSELEVVMHNDQEVESLTVAVGYEGIDEWLSQGEALLNRTNPEFRDARELCDNLEIPRIAPVTDEQKRYLGAAAI